MIVETAFASLLIVQAAAAPVSALLRIEHVECTSVGAIAGLPVFRADVTLSNLSNSALVAWTVRWHDSERPNHWLTSFQDEVLSRPDRQVAPGATVVSRWNVPCDLTPAVVAAVFSDGSFLGDAKAIDGLRFRREQVLRGIGTILSVIRTTPLGDSGVDGVRSIDSIVSQVSGPDVREGGRAMLSALGRDPRTWHILDLVGPRRVVLKAVVLEVLEQAERDVQVSLQNLERK